MIHHFVNCISLRGFTPNHLDSTYVDSLSLKICLRLNGVVKTRVSGVRYHTVNMDRLSHDTLYLVNHSKFEPCDRLFIGLPNFSTVEDVCNFELNVPDNVKRVVIGISSPKQDILAQKLATDRKDLDIYCLGAAVYSQNFPLNFDKFGMTWLYLGYRDRKRMLTKIRKTLVSFAYFSFTTRGRRKIKEVFGSR